MPYRDRARVEGWVNEYNATHDVEALRVGVLDKNFESGPNSAIVIVTLRSASTITFLHPAIRKGAPVWMVTFEERNEPVDLDDAGLRLLAEDMCAVAELRSYLQEKTDALLVQAH
ncbi:protein-L-isoaspartate carboxylmethyltransferase [Microbacterium sp. USHLN186]|uniref:protein-L-isoaspartate carboxylmethyltransferase n=1 Tax=Microbacterium sp. USHLN186 TaxID=3081286 RepID=UPI003015FDB0